MSEARRALLWFLLVVLLVTVALMVTGDPGTQAQPLVTTPSTTQPVIAHIEETP